MDTANSTNTSKIEILVSDYNLRALRKVKEFNVRNYIGTSRLRGDQWIFFQDSQTNVIARAINGEQEIVIGKSGVKWGSLHHVSTPQGDYFGLNGIFVRGGYLKEEQPRKNLVVSLFSPSKESLDYLSNLRHVTGIYKLTGERFEKVHMDSRGIGMVKTFEAAYYDAADKAVVFLGRDFTSKAKITRIREKAGSVDP